MVEYNVFLVYVTGTIITVRINMDCGMEGLRGYK